jgi:hypothetical protein
LFRGKAQDFFIKLVKSAKKSTECTMSPEFNMYKSTFVFTICVHTIRDVNSTQSLFDLPFQEKGFIITPLYPCLPDRQVPLERGEILSPPYQGGLWLIEGKGRLSCGCIKSLKVYSCPVNAFRVYRNYITCWLSGCYLFLYLFRQKIRTVPISYFIFL